ncbi:hypothetical protein TanjilG_00763 [Lupinus angustifolius]|uniref:Uncharacterized protein n=1 Tax=Lupinus angustifolius TaxID=3871 RepID=A0A4P1R7J8_LUPAN|nr:hypothetical protein TanjilG_00763 [Lupinus angustifolius]
MRSTHTSLRSEARLQPYQKWARSEARLQPYQKWARSEARLQPYQKWARSEARLQPYQKWARSEARLQPYQKWARWESRLQSYQKWGWSREISLSAFRKFPFFMSLTEERFAKSMNFLVNDMGWPSEDIAAYPVVLAYSLEKRIIPRCRIIKILKSKDLIKNSLSIGTFTCRSEKSFLMKYVTKFLGDVPLLLDVYKGSVDHRDLL